MTGIIGAMKIEIETIRSMLENKEEKQIGGVLFVKGLLRGSEVVTAECGIGKVAAAICTQTMIMEYAPDCIINTGVGGSLSDELDVCDAVVGEYLVQHDMDTTPLGDPPGLISGLGIVKIPADKEVCDKLKTAAEKARRALLAATRKDGVTDYAQGDTKGVGFYSARLTAAPAATAA